MKKTLSIFSAMVFAGFGFVAPAWANENEEGLVSNGIEVSEIIERTEIPELYENTTTFEVKTHPDHQELSVGAYFGEEYVDGEALVPEYKENSAVFDFSEVELTAGDTITFYVQDGLVFSEEFVRTVQPAEEGTEEGDNTDSITLADFNLPELNEDTTIYEVDVHPDTTIRAYFGEVALETEFLDSEYADGSTFFDFSDRELEVGETVIFNTSNGLQFEERIERTVQPAEEAIEEAAEESTEEEGGALPNTATNTPMMLVLSISLVVVGGALLVVRRRKSFNV